MSNLFTVLSRKKIKNSFQSYKFNFFFLMSNLFTVLSRKKIKNSFQSYKFNFFFLKPAIALVGNKDGKSVGLINNFLAKNMLLNRKLEKSTFDNICGKIRLSIRRLHFSKFIKKKKKNLRYPKLIFDEFQS